MENYKKLKTVNACMKALKRDPKKLPVVSGIPKGIGQWVVDMYLLASVIEAINGGWKPNWNDSSQRKYFLWPCVKASEKKPSGFGFSDTHCGYAGTRTGTGSRVCFESEAKARFFFENKQFNKLFIACYLIAD
jgi:hypothetical protein